METNLLAFENRGGFYKDKEVKGLYYNLACFSCYGLPNNA